MRKLALLVFISLVGCMFASAATVTLNCSLFPVTFSGATGSTTVACSGFSPPPGTSALNSVSLTLLSDYQFGSGGANDIQVTFGPLNGNPSGVTWTINTVVEHVTGGVSSGAIGNQTDACATGCTLANFNVGSFNVAVSSAVISGSAATSSGAVQVTYNYTTGVPEPGSILLSTIGLLGFSILGRKKFIRP